MHQVPMATWQLSFDIVLIFQRFIPVLWAGLILSTTDLYPIYLVYFNAGNVIVFIKGLHDLHSFMAVCLIY